MDKFSYFAIMGEKAAASQPLQNITQENLTQSRSAESGTAANKMRPEKQYRNVLVYAAAAIAFRKRRGRNSMRASAGKPQKRKRGKRGSRYRRRKGTR